MRWLVFAIAAYLALGLEVGLRPLLVVGNATPGVVLILLVFIATAATPGVTVAAAVVLGVLLDLSTPWPASGVADTVIVGPHALGMTLAAYMLLQVRTMLFRESPLTLACLTLVAGLFLHLAVVFLLTARGFPMPLAEPVPQFNPAGQLAHRFFDLLYTTLAAIPIGWLLLRTEPIWQFAPTKSHY